MYQKIIERIKAYDTIVIHRHKNPDLDALGSQLGLKGLIEENFKGKKVFVVGDENEYCFLGKMDRVEDTVFEGALSIVVDVAVKDLVSDSRYTLSKEVMIIDHHLNGNDFGDVFCSYAEHIATSQILTHMAMVENLAVSSHTATKLLAGIIGDSGRFLYPSVNVITFKSAAFLMENGADLNGLYENMYNESLNLKKLKGHFINQFKMTNKNVAYMKNYKELKDAFNVSTFAVSRGMVNQMAGINGVPIWVNFTEEDDGKILCELRSKEIIIVDIAKKYGGGGHALACGCTLNTWDQVDSVLDDLDRLIEKSEIDG